MEWASAAWTALAEVAVEAAGLGVWVAWAFPAWVVAEMEDIRGRKPLSFFFCLYLCCHHPPHLHHHPSSWPIEKLKWKGNPTTKSSLLPSNKKIQESQKSPTLLLISTKGGYPKSPTVRFLGIAKLADSLGFHWEGGAAAFHILLPYGGLPFPIAQRLF